MRFPCFKTQYMGHIHDDSRLSLLYNATDVMVVSSMIEYLPQTATEVQACGTLVVAFETTGLVDIVAHKGNGFLVEEFDSNILAKGIKWYLNNLNRKCINSNDDFHENISVITGLRKIYNSVKYQRI